MSKKNLLWLLATILLSTVPNVEAQQQKLHSIGVIYPG